MGIKAGLATQSLYRAKEDYLRSVEWSCRREVFGRKTIERILRYGAPVGSVIEHHHRLDRCMTRLTALIREEEQRQQVVAAGTVIVADQLDGATGRFQRSWHAPAGGIWLAMAWPDTLLASHMHFVPFAVGLACCETIRLYGVPAHIKWVNDIHVGGRKIAGILCQSFAGEMRDNRYILLGIGLNANNLFFPDDLSGSATSLAAELGHGVDLDVLLVRLLAKLSWNLGLLLHEEAETLQRPEGEELAPAPRLLEQWISMSDTIGRLVGYGFDIQKEIMYQAVVRGVDERGGLQMQLVDGTLITEYSGEIVYLDQ